MRIIVPLIIEVDLEEGDITLDDAIAVAEAVACQAMQEAKNDPLDLEWIGLTCDAGQVEWDYKGVSLNKTDRITERLERLRIELQEERISYDELHELQSLAPFIDKGDVQLLEAAGVPEFPEE